jgi:hypothetical protein
MKKQHYLSGEQIASFGNYLLSPEREEKINMVNEGINRDSVTHADFYNWTGTQSTYKNKGALLLC